MPKNIATLTCRIQPYPDQVERLEAFLTQRYGKEIRILVQQDASLDQGFILRYGPDIFDWTSDHLQRQFQMALDQEGAGAADGLAYLAKAKDLLVNWQPQVKAEELGQVITVGDGIAQIQGLEHVAYHEIVTFAEGSRGMVVDIQKDQVSAIIFGDDTGIEEGSTVYRSGREAGIPLSDEVLGRVIDPLGQPIDDRGPIKASRYYPVEYSAPSIQDRAPVSRPLETGILAIDSMFPIGKGQRELIIGDRQTGKTAIAIDTILNQKGKNVICIYVSIGQRTSSVARLIDKLRKQGAMDYTIVLAAFAGDPVALQYLAPYSGTSIAEYFMKHGRDVLIVYDDLSKHAVAYRSISLLLERFPGREAYPGDIFYLHSRLLERSAQLSLAQGGGSLTALPIVETQSGDISAYIPTNVISITDGQIFLETNLFHAGQRPAINVGLSVSRVGGAAQSPAMKQAAGSLRLLLAQYREMEVFTQFSGDLDQASKDQLLMGQGIMQVLRQNHDAPLTRSQEVVRLLVSLQGCLKHFAPSLWRSEIDKFLPELQKEEPIILEKIDQTGLLSPQDRARILELAASFWQLDPQTIGLDHA
ncbi:MAG: F0F1 ATP synthase subunit alpha [Eubacteriales bacterium]|nr:F0F1 ATP synthase subunit alpha [Clostridiales bacterium]MDY5836581.1 F0F1 ATP synthase subunit alpha [Eubacteriales bacterium]